MCSLTKGPLVVMVLMGGRQDPTALSRSPSRLLQHHTLLLGGSDVTQPHHTLLLGGSDVTQPHHTLLLAGPDVTQPSLLTRPSSEASQANSGGKEQRPRDA